ncbi:hypothetical protein LOTGIDRAFT_164641, partial [Lottia gigantea]
NKAKGPKKFGYKQKNLHHPLRNINKTPVLQPEEIKKPKPEKDFVKRNRERIHKKQVSKKDTGINSGTVTLTQEQLNAILQSVGNLKEGKENALRISIDPDSHEVKITSPRRGKTTAEVTSSRSVRQENSDDNEGDIFQLALGENEKRDEEDSKEVEKFISEISARKEKSEAKELSRNESKEDNESSVIHLPPVPPAHLTVAEKKRLQWAREKGESENYNPWGKPGAGAPVRNNVGDVLADYNTRKEDIKTSPRHQPPVTLEPFSPRSKRHQNLDGPVKGTLDIGQLTDEDKLLAKKEEAQRKFREDLEKQLEEKRQREREEKARENMDNTWSNKFSNEHKPASLPAQNTSPPQQAEYISSKKSPRRKHDQPENRVSAATNSTSQVPPAAMRSSFALGGLALDDNRYKQTKAEEKRKWLEDLEKQMEEKRLQTLKDKEKQTISECTDKINWADPVQIPPSVLNTSPRSDHYSLIHNSGEFQHDTARTSSAPDPPTDQTLIRGQNVIIDPVTLKDLEMKRKKHLDHQEAIKHQIEEKQNNLRKEREKKWAEEQEAEERLKKEREVLQTQFEVEQQKIREKEQAREEKLRQLKAAMDEAQERAQHEKQLKRMHHLQQGGHDITHLKAHYEGIQARSPRGQNQQSQPGFLLNLNEDVPAVDSSYQSHHSNPTQRSQTGQQVHHDDYIVDKVVEAPKKPSEPFTDPYSILRNFGTQTISDGKEFNRELSEVQIEYKVPDETMEKQKQKHGKTKTKNKTVRLKSAAKVRKFKVEKPQPMEKKEWNYKNQKNLKNVKNSEKDPFYEQKKRESQARHAKRAEQLYKMIEANKAVIPTENGPGSRDTSPRRYHSQSPRRSSQYSPRVDRSLSPHLRSETRVMNPKSPRAGQSLSPPPSNRHTPHRSRLDNYQNHVEQPTQWRSPPVPAVKHRHQYNNEVEDRGYDDDHFHHQYKDNEPIYPPVTENDFIPFTRTTEVLDPSHAEEPLTVSRENTKVQRGRKAYRDNQHPGDYGRGINNYQDKGRQSHQKDPMYNPSVITDHPTGRQDEILLQLSQLKQNLIQKQRELETTMSPSALLQ